MGRTNRTVIIAEEVHAALLSTNPPGNKVPRDKFNSIVQKHYRIGGQQTRNVANDGESLGLWKRERGTGTEGAIGWIELLLPQASIEPGHTG